MEVDHTGVHVMHCCDKCGCRYGDEDCPVANGKLKPAYVCEDCESDRQYLIEKLRGLSPEEFAALLAEVTPNGTKLTGAPHNERSEGNDD